MEFRVLGPLEVLGDDGEALPLGGKRPRALLAVLLLHPNDAVSSERLIDAVWGEDPPASVRGALQVHVHGLRRRVRAARARLGRSRLSLLRERESAAEDVSRRGRRDERQGLGLEPADGAGRRWLLRRELRLSLAD